MQYQEMSDEQLIDGNDNQHLIGGKINSNELPEISLPFNWVDWIDLTMLNKEFSNQCIKDLNVKIFKQIVIQIQIHLISVLIMKILVKKLSKSFSKWDINTRPNPGFIINDHERHEHIVIMIIV